jgi:hypothetical protein
MSRRGERDRAKERYWRSVVRQWRLSGLSIRQFCADHQLAEPNFYAWRRTLAQRDVPARPRRHNDRPEASAAPAAFVPVRLADAVAGPATLEVVLSGARVVRVPVGFDADTLRQLLIVLQETPPC